MGDVYSCRLFPSGMVVLSGGADRQLKIWSILDGSCPRTLVGHSRGTGHTYFTTTINYFEKRRFSHFFPAGITDTVIIDRGRNIICESTLIIIVCVHCANYMQLCLVTALLDSGTVAVVPTWLPLAPHRVPSILVLWTRVGHSQRRAWLHPPVSCILSSTMNTMVGLKLRA